MAIPSDRLLADQTTTPLTGLELTEATVEPAGDGWFRLGTTPGATRPAVAWLSPEGAWDLSQHGEVRLSVRNSGSEPVAVLLRVETAASYLDGRRDPAAMAGATVAPDGAAVELTVPLGNPRAQAMKNQLVSMVNTPFGPGRHDLVDGQTVTRIWLELPHPPAEPVLLVGTPVAAGPAVGSAAPDDFFPFIDTFGQYAHGDWPGKTHRVEDLVARREAERWPDRPADWDRFGGWAAGPQLPATGYFRTEQIDGWWHLVDPDGRLFWSHGCVRVGTRVRVGGVYRGTPLDDREHYFRLPPADSPLHQFHGVEPQSTRGYYLGRHNHRVYDFLEANLFRKYGTDWLADYATAAHRRLAGWALNTIANSSDPAVYLRRQTPYTAVAYSAPMGAEEHRIAGSGGSWGKMPDPFDPGWRAALDRTLREELAEVLGDPWCLGFFVDNELHWGDDCHLAEAVLASPAEQPAKLAFLAELRDRYGSVTALNAAWQTDHADWADLAASTTPPSRETAARADLVAFTERLIATYFRGCREAVKAASPHHLYLGCRFAGVPGAMVGRIAAEHCDVVSINRYTKTIADLRLPAGPDRPILIGEFHFGACDRGLWAPPALVPVADQAARGEAYRTYVASALANPAVVGTHWFQYYDQPTTGRFDGENYQTGLLDLCDTPYPETVAACRAMGEGLYQRRAAAAAGGDQ